MNCEKTDKCDVTWSSPPFPCHKLSHFLRPPPPRSVTYFMNGPLYVVSECLANNDVTNCFWMVTWSTKLCSGSIVVTTLDCGPGGSWFESWVGANILWGSIDCTELTRAIIPLGIVHWVPVLSNIKTANGCESNRQLQLWTVFAWTVVYILSIQRYSRMGWAAMSHKMPGCHLANAWRSCSKHIPGA